MPSKKEYNLIEAIEALGAEVAPDTDIVTVKMVGSAKAPIVRVYIDHTDGVSFELLADTQRWVGALLDEIDPFPGAYTLEVSSPGPNRPLRKFEHFKAAEGRMVKIKTSQPVDERAAFTGTIKSADKDTIVVVLDEGKPGQEPVHKIPFELIISANIKDN